MDEQILNIVEEVIEELVRNVELTELMGAPVPDVSLEREFFFSSEELSQILDINQEIRKLENEVDEINEEIRTIQEQIDNIELIEGEVGLPEGIEFIDDVGMDVDVIEEGGVDLGV